MSNKARNTSGKFAAKSETPRKIRSVNLTDDAWQWLAEVATQAGVSRNDYLEAMAEGNIPFMETAKLQASPLMETVESNDAEIEQQPESEVSPFMETVQVEWESLKRELGEVKADRAKPLEFSTHITNKLREELQELRSQLQTEKARWADLEEELQARDKTCAQLQGQLSDLKHKSATAEKEFPDAADVLNQLRAKRKKSKAERADVEAILEILQG